MDAFALPMDADPSRDQVVGYDEFGRPVRAGRLGTRYIQGAAPHQRNSLAGTPMSLADVMATSGGARGAGQPRQTSQLAPANAPEPSWGPLGGLANMLLEGFQAPGNALAGRPVTLGEVYGTAGVAAMGGTAVPRPANALGANSFRASTPPRGVRVWSGGAGDPLSAASDRGAWFSEAEDLAKEYAGSTGRVTAAEIDPRNPISFRHAEQSRPIGDVISTALEGAADTANLDAVRPIVDRLTARYGTTARPLFEYWNQDKDVADLFRALGYDAISVAEKSDMKAKTWAALDPSIVKVTPATAQVGLEDALRAKYPDVKLSISGDAEKGFTLNRIEVPKAGRGAGTGTKVMNDFTAMADAVGAPVRLSPSADFGGSPARLREFYKRFGFVDNAGKNKDFSTRETMLRPSAAARNEAQN